MVRTNHQSGFTLIELVIVIVILGILAAVAVPKFIDLAADAEKSACLANMHSIEAAASLIYAQNAVAGAPAFPADLAAVATQLTSGTAPTCPSGGTYTYVAADGTVSCDQATHTR